MNLLNYIIAKKINLFMFHFICILKKKLIKALMWVIKKLKKSVTYILKGDYSVKVTKERVDYKYFLMILYFVTFTVSIAQT